MQKAIFTLVFLRFCIIFLMAFSSLKAQHTVSIPGHSSAAPDDSARYGQLVDYAYKLESGGNYKDAILILRRAQDIALSLGQLKFYIDAGQKMSRNLIHSGDYFIAKKILDSMLVLAKNEKYIVGEGTSYRLLAEIKLSEGAYKEATRLYLDAQKKWLESGNQVKVSTGYTDLGNVYYVRGLFNDAYAYFRKALVNDSTANLEDELAVDYNNIGLILLEMTKYTEAKREFLKAIEINRRLGSKLNLYQNYSNLLKLEYSLGHIDKALQYGDTALKLISETDNLSKTGEAFSNVCELYRANKDYHRAIDYGRKALSIAVKTNDHPLLSYVYQNLAFAFKDNRQPDSAFNYILAYTAEKDTLVNIENTKQMVELEKRFELNQKEKENQLLNQTIKIKEVESSRQQLVILLIGTILLVLGSVAFILVRQNRLKNKINRQLEEKNQIIEYQHKNITDSIHYSRRIQDAILPPMQLWNELLPQSFIIYKPKDIVSGDFYWMEKVKDTIFFAAADCTGHGVPGAMVSVVCSTALNRAVKEFGITDPGQILDKVRELVLETFEKSESDVKDGMDISLVALHRTPNSELYTVKWSGANNPLWYLQNNEPKEITGDKQPVGKADNPHPFKTHSVQLSKGDAIYIFTDGYADQFGGLKGKKLKYKNFRNTILKNVSFEINTQRRNIEQAFIEWKGDHEQVDDVCVIGVRL